jgi:hypothetical protein
MPIADGGRGPSWEVLAVERSGMGLGRTLKLGGIMTVKAKPARKVIKAAPLKGLKDPV